ncbi:hypothetical protein [Komarekiella delphini-convector]|nr:hypothetical protein [Komarekiella delphini-convector]
MAGGEIGFPVLGHGDIGIDGKFSLSKEETVKSMLGHDPSLH